MDNKSKSTTTSAVDDVHRQLEKVSIENDTVYVPDEELGNIVNYMFKFPADTSEFYSGEDEEPEDWENLEKKQLKQKENIPMDELLRLYKPWKRALIITLFGRDDISLETLIPSLNEIWEIFDVVSAGLGFFAVRFATKECYEQALLGGPWVVQGHFIVVRRWNPSFKPSDSVCSVVSVDWVRFTSDVVIGGDLLIRLGSLAGKVVRVDEVASRVFVEVDMGETLLASCVSVEGREYGVEYEGIQNVCMLCGKYGEHDQKRCLSVAIARGGVNERVSEQSSEENVVADRVDKKKRLQEKLRGMRSGRVKSASASKTKGR